MYLQPTTNLITAMKSIATLTQKERDLLIATLGTPPTTPTNNKPTINKRQQVQFYINKIVAFHNAGGYQKNQKRLEKLKNTRKIGSYFHKAANSCLS